MGFDAKILESNDRILLIKPLQIGVDSNISVIDNEGKVFLSMCFLPLSLAPNTLIYRFS